MRLVRKHEVNEPILYDGRYSEDLYSPKYLTLDSGERIMFSPNELKGNKLENLFKELDKVDKRKILAEGHISNNAPDYLRAYMGKEQFDALEYDYYGSEHHISIEYLKIDRFLLLLSFGEKQPGRWVLKLEDIWEFTS